MRCQQAAETQKDGEIHVAAAKNAYFITTSGTTWHEGVWTIVLSFRRWQGGVLETITVVRVKQQSRCTLGPRT